MDFPKKYTSNAISDDCPSYFKSDYIPVKKSSAHSTGKKIFPKSEIKNILTPRPEFKSAILIKNSTPKDQNLDSLKLSLQPDITKGYKNTLRFKSNHYKHFFEVIETIGFRRLSSEITSLHKMPQITRTLKEMTAKVIPKTTKIVKTKPEAENRPSELSYIMEYKSKKNKKTILPKISSKNFSNESDIDVFEKRLKQESFRKSRNVRELYDTNKKLASRSCLIE